jgi:hypothetical protein
LHLKRNSLGGCGLESSGSEQGQMIVSCEQRNEPLGSIKGGEFLNLLNDYQLLKKDSAPQN